MITPDERIKRLEESAKRHFQNFKPTYKQFDGIETLDWRNENGSIEYYVRYVFDTQNCKMYVSGDLGCGIFNLSWNPTLENTATHAESYSYMHEKLALGCSSDLHDYDEAIARSELKDRFNQDPGRFRRAVKSAFDERKPMSEVIDLLMRAYDYRNGMTSESLLAMSGDEAQDFLNAFDRDYYEWFFDLGKGIHPRVIAWLVGLHMAWKMIDGGSAQATATETSSPMTTTAS